MARGEVSSVQGGIEKASDESEKYDCGHPVLPGLGGGARTWADLDEEDGDCSC